jgi:hypothetical protein
MRLIYPGDFANGQDLFTALGELLPLLQPSSSTPGARLSRAGPVPAPTQKEEVLIVEPEFLERYLPRHERAMAHYSAVSPDHRAAPVVEMDETE